MRFDALSTTRLTVHATDFVVRLANAMHAVLPIQPLVLPSTWRTMRRYDFFLRPRCARSLIGPGHILIGGNHTLILAPPADRRHDSAVRAPQLLPTAACDDHLASPGDSVACLVSYLLQACNSRTTPCSTRLMWKTQRHRPARLNIPIRASSRVLRACTR